VILQFLTKGRQEVLEYPITGGEQSRAKHLWIPFGRVILVFRMKVGKELGVRGITLQILSVPIINSRIVPD